MTTTAALVSLGIRLKATVLRNLTLSSSTFDLSAAAGSVLATISGATAGSTLSLSGAGSVLALSSDQTQILRGVGPASAGGFSFTLVETLAGALNTPRSNAKNFTITGLASGPSFLNSASFSAPEGADFDFTLSFSEPCNVAITGGAGANKFQLSGPASSVSSTSLRLFSQAYSGAGGNAYPVNVQITSVATGLTASQAITGTVAAVGAPVPVTPPAITTTSIEGGTSTATPGVWTGAETVTGQWYVNGVPVAGATGLSYAYQEADVGFVPKYRETATSAGGLHSVSQDSNNGNAVLNGVIAAIAMRNAALDLTDADRWTYCLSTDTSPDGGVTKVNRAPTTGPGSYNFYFSPSGTFVTNSAAWKEVAGKVAMTGAGFVAVVVPANVDLNVYVCLGSESNTLVDGVAIWDGTNTATATKLYEGPVAGTGVNVPLGSIMDINGNLQTAGASFFSSAQFQRLNSSTGLMVFRRPLTAGQMSLRAIQIYRPEFSINHKAANIGGVAFSDVASGSDTTGLGTTAAPFQNIVGDPAAGGVVATFAMGPGESNKLRTGTYRPKSYTGRPGNALLQSPGQGTSGNPVILTADTGATPIIDGSVLISSWAAVNSGDTGGPWENPNHANLQKTTGLTGVTPLIDGEDVMFPAQFPNPFNPADVGLTYPGTDAYVQMNASYYATNSIVEDANNTCDANGSPGAGGYHKAKFTIPEFATHYGSGGVSINLSNTAARALIHNLANKLEEHVVLNHVPATGYFEVVLQDAGVNPVLFFTSARPPGVSQLGLMAMRYHPFDIRKPGQYGYDTSGTAFGHFLTSTRGRISSDLSWGFQPANDYNTLDGVTLRRVGLNSGGAVADAGSGPQRKGLVVSNTRITQCVATSVPTGERLITLQGGSSPNYTTGGLTNVTIDNCQTSPGVTAGPATPINGLKCRDLDGTCLITQYLAPSPLAHKNLDFCDMVGVHQNGIAAYQNTANTNFSQVLMLNMNISLSTQPPVSNDGTTPRGNTYKNMFMSSRPGYLDPATHTQYPPTNGECWQFDCGELDMIAEGLVIAGLTTYGRSYGTSNLPSSRSTIKNCVFWEFTCTLDLTGITFQDCLFLCASGSSFAALRSIGDITDKGGNDGGNNVFLSPSPTNWAGGFTSAMQKALTVNHGLGTYTARNIGLEATAFNNTGKTCIIPAWDDATFTLGDTVISTDTIRSQFRPGINFGVIFNPCPDVTFTLAAGQGDNALFQLSNGYVSLAAGGTGIAAGSTGTLHLVIDAASSNAKTVGGNLGGGKTQRTTININVV